MNLVLDKEQLQAWSSIATIVLAASVPFISARHARSLSRMASRQNQIEALRADLSSFLANSTALHFLVSSGAGQDDFARVKQLTEHVELARASVALRLDVSDPDQAELRDTLNDVAKLTPDKNRYADIYKLATEVARRVLESETDRLS